MNQPVGLVVAKSQPEAIRAAKKVKIQYEELPAIVSIKVLECIGSPPEVLIGSNSKEILFSM